MCKFLIHKKCVLSLWCKFSWNRLLFAKCCKLHHLFFGWQTIVLQITYKLENA